MSNDQKGLEIKVGMFVFAGLIAIAVMAVEFGRLGQGLTKYYPVTVEFPNASGLVKNADVQLAGAIIGHVADHPQLLPGHIGTVFVTLEIQEGVKLPNKSSFIIGSSGLLGDKFVQVAPPDGFDQAKFNPQDASQIILSGTTITTGTPEDGIAALQKLVKEKIEKLSDNLDQLKITLDEVNTRLPKLLSDENLNNLSTTFANVKTTSDNFAAASKKIDDVIVGAKGVVSTAKETISGAKETIDTAKQAMATVNGAATDIRGAVKDARGVVQSASALLKTASSGPGSISMLLGNREVADNLRALISNIRRHGLLFYKDNATPSPDSASSHQGEVKPESHR